MECGRRMIYFSNYENGVKVSSVGYAAIFIRGESCGVQLYYRGRKGEEAVLCPVYVFSDGTVTTGEELLMREGMAVAEFKTAWQSFAGSGRCLEALEAVYLDGVTSGYCGGRADGRDLEEPVPVSVAEMGQEYALADDMLQEENSKEEEVQPEEHWTLAECVERFPKLRLPFDGIRRKCCRIGLEELEHLPEEWEHLKNNGFLLHGFYEYHHLLFARLACRYGERYAIGIPGEFCYRNQYMAENYGCYDFAPLEPGRRRGGCFGYWYYYLDVKH